MLILGLKDDLRQTVQAAQDLSRIAEIVPCAVVGQSPFVLSICFYQNLSTPTTVTCTYGVWVINGLDNYRYWAFDSDVQKASTTPLNAAHSLVQRNIAALANMLHRGCMGNQIELFGYRQITADRLDGLINRDGILPAVSSAAAVFRSYGKPTPMHLAALRLFAQMRGQ